MIIYWLLVVIELSKPIYNFLNKVDRKLVCETLVNIAQATAGPNCTFSRVRSDVSENGNIGTFTVELFLNGARASEEDALSDFIKKNNYPYKSSLYIDQNGQVYRLWGYLASEKDAPFIMMNLRNYDQFLVTDEFVKKFFTEESSIDPTADDSS